MNKQLNSIRDLLVLVIETALGKGSIGIYKGEKKIAAIAGEKNISRSQDLMYLIATAFEENNLQLAELNLITVSKGPGSSTGIRVGVATARALSFALGCSLIEVTVLEAVAFAEENEIGLIAAVLPSMRNSICWQFISSDKSIDQKVVFGTIQEFSEFVKTVDVRKIKLITGFDSKDFKSNLFREFSRHEIISASDNVLDLLLFYSTNKIQ